MHSFLYFHNGSIGDFLMTLYFMELLHTQEKSRELFIFVPKYGRECRELAEGYPYVHVLTKRSELFLFFLKPVMCITPPTPGIVSFKTKMVAWSLSIFKGKMIGFDDGSEFSKFFYSTLLVYDMHVSYYKTMQKLAALFGEVDDKEPIFHFRERNNALSRLGVKERSYTVIHPRGSDEKRSLSKEYVASLLACVSEYNGTIFMSGTERDIENYRDLVDGKSVTSLAEVPLLELATLLRYARLYVGVDTGITHLSALSGGRGLALAHPGTRYPWFPSYSDKFTTLFEGEGDPREQETFSFPSSQKVCEEIRKQMGV